MLRLRLFLLLAACTGLLLASSNLKAGDDHVTSVYSTTCSVCHGNAGKGDGPAAAGLNPKPADFSSPDFQKSRSDEHLLKIIREGGLANGKSPLMPAFGHLDAATLSSLVGYVRSMGASSAGPKVAP